MKSVVEVDINLPRVRLAELFADPGNNPKWMDDIERVEAISGRPGQAGSVYRLVPKEGKQAFVATVVSRRLPNELRLRLEAPRVRVAVNDKLYPLPDGKTRLVSEEIFIFKGALGKLSGLFARGAIKSAHRRHMQSFKHFAESQVRKR